MILRTSYLHNGVSYTGKMTSLYWIKALTPCGIRALAKIVLTHWGRVTHICVGNLAIIGSDNGLSPGRRQAIIWTKAGILLIGTLGTNFSDISLNRNLYIFIQENSFENIVRKTAAILSQPQCVNYRGKWVLVCHEEWFQVPKIS